MSNPLYNAIGVPDIVKQFRQFESGFHGDAQAEVQKLLNSGRVTQEQYNRAVQMAQQLQQMLGR